jgi:hypothetical protein
VSGLVTGASAIAAAIGVIFSARTFAFNSKVNRARFLYDLHRDFFVNDTYIKGKDLIDEPPDPDQLSQAVLDETKDLIGLLNFFELIAYYARSSVLTHGDVDALVGYYLDRLSHHAVVVNYITEERTSFEHLSWLLHKRKLR